MVETDLWSKKQFIENYLLKSRPQLSSFSFVNIFAWKDFFCFEMVEEQDNLCLFARNETGMFAYLPPLGRSIHPQAIRMCFNRMEDVNTSDGLSRIENVAAHQLRFFPKEEFRHYLKGYEYCYFRDHLVSLKGNRYKTKRSSYNQFIRNYSYEYRNFSKDMIPECLGLYSRWAKERKRNTLDDIYIHMIDENFSVHQLLMEYSDRLGLVGRVVFVNGTIQAYSFGFPLNDNMFCILLEIGDHTVDGLSTYLFREFCADPQLKKFLFINAMDDCLFPNLKQIKMSFRPVVLLSSYNIEKR